MSSLSFLAKAGPAAAIAALALPGVAFGQATRTWVSGVGDDANPCSRTAPCKTFAGAISKTAAGGEIDALDPGGFGAVTITKAITIRGDGVTAGVLTSGTNGIVISAGATDHVVLSGLDMDGLNTSLSGVKVLQAGSVVVNHDDIYGFKVGVDVEPNASPVRVQVLNSTLHNNGIGAFNAPANNGVNFSALTLRNDDVVDNTCGAATSSFGANNGPPDSSSDCGAAGSGSGISRTAVISAYNTVFGDNTTGVFARGGAASFEIGADQVTGNQTGLQRVDGATIKSFGNNEVSNNGSSMSPSTTASLSKVRGGRHGYSGNRKRR